MQMCVCVCHTCEQVCLASEDRKGVQVPCVYMCECMRVCVCVCVCVCQCALPLEMVRAGDHCDLRMSRQMLPLLLIFGW